MKNYDVVIIGGGAAGMMCAIEAAQRGRSVLVLEHNESVGEKIRISGGGRCNFTNIDAGAKNFVGANPKFALSALSQFGSAEMMALVEKHNIEWEQRELGQLFCLGSARQIIDMLVSLMARFGVVVKTGIEVRTIGKRDGGFLVSADKENFSCSSLVVACGGKSIPKMGASNFGYKIAEQFGLRLLPTRPGLVPLTFDPDFLARTAPLAGIGIKAVVTHKKTAFREALLFTHRGLSGPAILQISSYWREGEAIEINMLPDKDLFEILNLAREKNGKQEIQRVLAEFLPKRLAQILVKEVLVGENGGRLADLGNKKFRHLYDRVHRWQVKPTGSEGYRTAEVTLGGVDTRDINAKTLEARNVPGWFFIGEVVDITGWLGGYNFQWAWSSGFAAGQVV